MTTSAASFSLMQKQVGQCFHSLQYIVMLVMWHSTFTLPEHLLNCILQEVQGVLVDMVLLDEADQFVGDLVDFVSQGDVDLHHIVAVVHQLTEQLVLDLHEFT